MLLPRSLLTNNHKLLLRIKITYWVSLSPKYNNIIVDKYDINIALKQTMENVTHESQTKCVVMNLNKWNSIREIHNKLNKKITFKIQIKHLSIS